MGAEGRRLQDPPGPPSGSLASTCRAQRQLQLDTPTCLKKPKGQLGLLAELHSSGPAAQVALLNSGLKLHLFFFFRAVWPVLLQEQNIQPHVLGQQKPYSHMQGYVTCKTQMLPMPHKQPAVVVPHCQDPSTSEPGQERWRSSVTSSNEDSDIRQSSIPLSSCFLDEVKLYPACKGQDGK